VFCAVVKLKVAGHAFRSYIDHGLGLRSIIEENEERLGGGKLAGGVQAYGGRDVKWGVYVFRTFALDNDVSIVLPAVDNCNRFGVVDISLN